jgi:hypothetical protein
MAIKNLKLVTLSIVVALAVNNASHAGNEENGSYNAYAVKNLPTLDYWPAPENIPQESATTNISFGGFSYENKISSELSKADGNNDSENNLTFCDLLKTNNELDESELDFNYIMGLYLEFGRGNITVEKARDIAKTKVESLKSRVKEFQEKQQENMDKKGHQEVGNKEILEAVLLNMWDKIEQKISEELIC